MASHSTVRDRNEFTNVMPDVSSTNRTCRKVRIAHGSVMTAITLTITFHLTEVPSAEIASAAAAGTPAMTM
jgi:hypothetical protein